MATAVKHKTMARTTDMLLLDIFVTVGCIEKAFVVGSVESFFAFAKRGLEKMGVYP